MALFNSSPGKALEDVSDFLDSNGETENKNATIDSFNNIHPLYIDLKINETNLKSTKENESAELLINKKLLKKYDCQLCNFNQICEAKTDTNPTV